MMEVFRQGILRKQGRMESHLIIDKHSVLDFQVVQQEF
jgi:hypothetical protein